MDVAPLPLPAVLDLAAAGPLHAALLARLGGPVKIDAGEVRRLGGQCLQVLLAAQTRWAADGAAFDVLNPSPEFAEGLELLGATRLAVAVGAPGASDDDGFGFQPLTFQPPSLQLGADAPAELTA